MLLFSGFFKSSLSLSLFNLLSVCACVHAHWRPKEGVKFSRVRVTGCGKSSDLCVKKDRKYMELDGWEGREDLGGMREGNHA